MITLGIILCRTEIPKEILPVKEIQPTFRKDNIIVTIADGCINLAADV